MTMSKKQALKEWHELIQAARAKDRETAERLRPKYPSFLDYFAEMWSLPHTIRLRRPLSGKEGLRQDARNIRNYFIQAEKSIYDEIER